MSSVQSTVISRLQRFKLPNHICICDDCMHKTMETVSQFDYQGMLNNPGLYLVSSTTKVLTDFSDFLRETDREEFGVNTADAGYVHFVTRNIKQDISDKVHEYMSTLPEVVRSGYIVSETLFEDEDESIQVNMIDKDIAAIGNLMLSDEDKKILENIGEDERIVFAGYNYRKQYHAGDMINCYVDDDIGQIKIGGILKKGAGWIHEDRLFKGSYGKWDNYTLDDSIRDNAVFIGQRMMF